MVPAILVRARDAQSATRQNPKNPQNHAANRDFQRMFITDAQRAP
jgi:hypothetical protein